MYSCFLFLTEIFGFMYLYLFLKRGHFLLVLFKNFQKFQMFMYAGVCGFGFFWLFWCISNCNQLCNLTHLCPFTMLQEVLAGCRSPGSCPARLCSHSDSAGGHGE